MIYIIISNVGMAIMMIFLYIRYSHFRISSAHEIRELHENVEKEFNEKKAMQQNVLQLTNNSNEKVEGLLRQIDELRKEKEGEIKLRFSAEKQIELALQKAEEVERRMQDWRVVQDAVMRDSKDAIVKVGNDLYKKLSDNYKMEVETNKNLFGRLSKNIEDFFAKFVAAKESENKPHATHQEDGVKQVAAAAATSAPKPILPAIHVPDPARKLVPDLVSTMKANGHLANKDYFLPANFDEQKAKLLLCEVAFISNNALHIIDFKACRYLAEFEQLKAGNRLAAEISLKQKLDKYLTYLSNPKYSDSILKVMASTRAKFGKHSIVMVLPTKAELQILKEIHYYEKINKAGFEIMDFDGVNDLVL